MKALRYILLDLIPGLAMIAVCLYTLVDIDYHEITQTNPLLLMKPSTLFAYCALFLLIAIVLVGCAATQYRPTTEYAVLIDETDSSFAVPDISQVIIDLGLDTDMWAGINFSLARITDVSYVPYSSIVLGKGGNRLASNQYARKREVIAFKTRLSELLDSVKNDTPGKPNSSVYLPLVNELTRLANSNAERKVFSVFSDLMENRPSLSFYNPQTFALLHSNPAVIEAKLFSHAKLPDLTGIEVRLIYQAQDAKDDAVFQIVSDFYKKLLESKGAKVTISANLTIR